MTRDDAFYVSEILRLLRAHERFLSLIHDANSNLSECYIRLVHRDENGKEEVAEIPLDIVDKSYNYGVRPYIGSAIDDPITQDIKQIVRERIETLKNNLGEL